ncbi:MAG: hypothetical protein QXK18_05805 [Candidatus Bathyarchaeia archaeon]
MKITAFVFSVVSFSGFINSVYADPLPYRPLNAYYALVVIIAELIALTIGAEVLSVMLKKIAKIKAPRKIVYSVMLVAMLISYFIGLLLSSMFL